VYHKIIIAGYLGRDPEMKYLPNGTPVTNFSVATSRKYTTQDGNSVDETIWFRVTAWRQLAETCNQYLTKGRAVLVEGRLRPDTETGGPRVYQRQDGSYAASFEVTASEVKFLGRGERAPEGEAPGPEQGEEEIPF